MERFVNVEKMIEALKDETCTACIDNRGDDTTYCETRCDFYAFLNEVESYAEQCGISVDLDGLDWQDAGFCWIPVSERLPEKCGWYLCTLKDDRVNAYYYSNGIWLDNAKKHLFDLYDIRSRFTGEIIKPEQESVYWTDWVTAWMPLPKGYKSAGQKMG